MNKKVLVIVGPTGVGKSKTAVSIASRYGNAEIINADSMQIYKYMNIGTAKPSKEEMKGIKHHLFDFVEPDTPFNVKDFLIQAESTIADVFDRGNIPIIVGGTGLYIKALLYGIFDAPSRDESIRNELWEQVSINGNDSLYEELKRVDPYSASRLHKNDIKRIIRALEVYKLTGRTIGELQQEGQTRNSNTNEYILLGITDERSQVYERIERRCDNMIRDGLIDEVRDLYEKGYDSHLQSMKAIGYKQILQYIKGEIDYNEMMRIFKRDSRRYAKRQWTLFNSIEGIFWLKINWNIDLFLQIPEKIKNIFITPIE